MAKNVTIDGNKFVFPEWYLQEHADKKKTSFWLAPIYHPNTFESQERNLIKKHFDGSERVLEIGGFVGVTSCLINNIVADKHIHTVVELLDKYADILESNRDFNKCLFEVVRGQIVRPSNRIYRDLYIKSKTINTKELFGRPYNTLVMDCEGAEFDFIDQHVSFVGSMKKLMIEWHRIKKGDRHKIRSQYVAKLKKIGFSMVESIKNVDLFAAK